MIFSPLPLRERGEESRQSLTWDSSMKQAICVVALICSLPALAAQEPCRSGLQPGARPGPYSSICITGANRGVSHCFICETADKPAVIVFARTLSEPLGKLVHKLDKSLAEHKSAELCGWVTFLADDQPTFDPKVAFKSKSGVQPLERDVLQMSRRAARRDSSYGFHVSAAQ